MEQYTDGKKLYPAPESNAISEYENKRNVKELLDSMGDQYKPPETGTKKIPMLKDDELEDGGFLNTGKDVKPQETVGDRPRYNHLVIPDKAKSLARRGIRKMPTEKTVQPETQVMKNFSRFINSVMKKPKPKGQPDLPDIYK